MTTTTGVTDEVIDLLRELRLPHMRRHAPDVPATAKAQRWEPAEAVRALLTEEVAGPRATSVGTRHKAAGFPTGKTFDAWDEPTSSIPAPTQRSLRTLEWVTNHENVVMCGPSGTGESHLFEALGHAAIETGAHVMWFSLEPRCAVPPSSCGRHDESRGPRNLAGRSDLHRRHQPLTRRDRDRRGPLPRRRRRLRTTSDRPVVEPASRRVR